MHVCVHVRALEREAGLCGRQVSHLYLGFTFLAVSCGRWLMKQTKNKQKIYIYIPHLQPITTHISSSMPKISPCSEKANVYFLENHSIANVLHLLQFSKHTRSSRSDSSPLAFPLPCLRSLKQRRRTRWSKVSKAWRERKESER